MIVVEVMLNENHNDLEMDMVVVVRNKPVSCNCSNPLMYSATLVISVTGSCVHETHSHYTHHGRICLFSHKWFHISQSLDLIHI